jgi:cell shape-determining protein MreC
MRRTVRPSTCRFIVLIVFLVSIVYFVLTELGRFHWGRVAISLASLLTFCFFAHGWVTR